MNPVVGLDVAKGESQVQAFLDKSKPFGKSFSMKHTREELDRFIGFLNEIEEMTGQMPMVILESTGQSFIFNVNSKNTLFCSFFPRFTHGGYNSKIFLIHKVS